MILSVDIETFGAVRRFADGMRSPEQHVFHPIRALHQHGVPLSKQIVTVAVTLCDSLPVPSKGESWIPFLQSIAPGDTRVFQLHKKTHRQWLTEWISKATVILGMNLPFDILWMRAQPYLRPYLSENGPLLIDLAVLNYLDSEMRPERSLKNIVSLFNIDRYDDEDSLKHGYRYSSPCDSRLALYNARDSHNTALAVRELGHRIRQRHEGSDKCSDWCIRHYSATLQLCIGMGEAGVPFSGRLLQLLENDCLRRAADARERALTRFNLPLDGPGSQQPQYAFMRMLADTIDSLRPGQPSILSDNRLSFTEKTRLLSTKDINREIFSMALPADHPLQEAIACWDEFKRCQKLLSSYTFPLLRGARKPSPKFSSKSVLINERAYPTWYPVPSPTKDGSGDAGGTEQVRLTCKNPAIQTLPREVKDCIRPSHPEGSLLWIDLSQIELRVAAMLSGEPTLIHSFITNSDLHTERAVQVFGRDELVRKYPSLASEPNLKKWKNVKEFDELERQCGKHGNFTDLNLGGAETLQKTILKKGGVAVPFSFCQEIVNTRPITRPVLYRWQMAQIEYAKKHHVVYLPFCGVSRYFAGHEAVIDETYRSTVVNFPIQGLAALLMCQFQIKLHREICPLKAVRYQARQCVNIYDATVLDCKPGVAATLRPTIQACFDSLSTGDGIWAKLQEHYGHSCPIAFDLKEITHVS